MNLDAAILNAVAGTLLIRESVKVMYRTAAKPAGARRPLRARAFLFGLLAVASLSMQVFLDLLGRVQTVWPVWHFAFAWHAIWCSCSAIDAWIGAPLEGETP